MTARREVVAATLIAFTLTGCAPLVSAAPDSTPTAERSTVDWANYPPEYQRIIDEETGEGDCAALQEMFDAAPADPDLLAYMNEALELAGCYS